MTFSPEPIAVRFDADNFWVDLEDGRTLGIPLVWFPRSPTHKAHPNSGGGEFDDCEIVFGMLFVSGSDSTVVFDFAKEPLDCVA